MKKPLVILIVLLVIAGAIKYFFPNRKTIAAYMAKKGYELSTKIWDYDYGYIRAWYFGIKANKPMFTYKDKKYNILNGRAIV